ncbi:RNA-binding S4 domain-containing protein [Leucothrix pacifica]|uniref:RNA-binding protein n=1 Tax=Leucothrix pacifica TaxID=1247513 RepID=A0A317CTN7_9GAMM|nr:RNA-binding S4 domain-containing protein [Leucothrix pacifica]PWQ99672.1 RNA-binding protein [Leucothrix pacifica]
MEKFELDEHDFIELNNLLKVTGLVDSGGLAKSLIGDGQVKVNGEVELRKRCKIYRGMVVEFGGQQVEVV